MTRSRSAVLGALCIAFGVLLLAQDRPPHPAANNPHLGTANRSAPAWPSTGSAAPTVMVSTPAGIAARISWRHRRGASRRAAVRHDPQGRARHRDARPGAMMSDDDILQIIAYLRNIGTVAPPERPIGNVDERRAALHAAVRVVPPRRRARRTPRPGPDAHRRASDRTPPSPARSARRRNGSRRPSRRSRIVTKDGQRIRGAKKAEDVFSIQIMDTRERIQGYLKSDLQEVIYEKDSLMPAYPAGASDDGDLTDLVGYLASLRGDDARRRRPRRRRRRRRPSHRRICSTD